MTSPPGRPPGTRAARGRRAARAGAATGVLVGLLVACGGPVQLSSQGVDPDAARSCRGLVSALPGSLSDQPEVSVEGAPGAAYEEGLTVRCGVAAPRTLDPFSTCQTVNGVDWYVPESAIEDPTADVVATTIARLPRVELVVPGDQRPPAGALAQLTDPVREHTRTTGPGCT